MKMCFCSVVARADGQDFVLRNLEQWRYNRDVAWNRTFFRKRIALGREAFGLPEKEAWQLPYFIR